MNSLKQKFSDLMRPSYHENVVFLYCVILILVYATAAEFRGAVNSELMAPFSDSTENASFWVIMVLVYFFFAMVFSVYHVVIRGRKTRSAKGTLLFLVVGTSLVISIVTLNIMLKVGVGWEVFIPLWNAIVAFHGLKLFRHDMFEDDAILDEDTSVPQLMFGIIAVSVLFLVLDARTGWHWSMVASACVAAASSLDEFYRQLVSGFSGPAAVPVKPDTEN